MQINRGMRYETSFFCSILTCTGTSSHSSHSRHGLHTSWRTCHCNIVSTNSHPITYAHPTYPDTSTYTHSSADGARYTTCAQCHSFLLDRHGYRKYFRKRQWLQTATDGKHDEDHDCAHCH